MAKQNMTSVKPQPAAQPYKSDWTSLEDSRADTPEGRRALARFCEALDPFVLQVCKRYFPKHAEDIKQEFLTVKVLTRYLSLHAVRGKGSLRAFVRLVLRSCARDWLRENQPRTEGGPRFTHIDPDVVNRLSAAGMTPATEYEHARVRELLHERLEQLRPRYEEREFEELIAFLLDEDDGAEAIGLRLGKSALNIRQKSLRLRRKLYERERRILQVNEEELRVVILDLLAGMS